MIQSYKQQYQIHDHYDAVIVGSGMGSLTTAAILAKEGKRVIVLERHYTAGGFTHVFKRKGYEWDVGIHYIGEMHRERSAMKKLFEYITEGELEWADMGEVYDRIFVGDQSFDFVKGVSNWKAKMKSYFPNEEKAIDDYVDLIFETSNASSGYFMDKALPNWMSTMSGPLLRKKYMKFASRTTHAVISELTEDPLLIKVLCGQYGDYGLPPKQSSFAMHASVVKHYFSGGSFPVGGSSRIVETIDPVIEKAGGTIMISAEVQEVVIENKKAIGVRMKDGKVIKGDAIVSGAGVFTTFDKLLHGEHTVVQKLKQNLDSVQRSVAHACLYIGLDATVEELDLPKTNLWIYPDDLDHDACIDRYMDDIEQPFPLVYVSFPAAKDPDWSRRYPGRSTIDIITLAPYEIFASYEGTRWMKRGDTYDEIKENLSQRLLEILYKHIPKAKDHIDHYELSSPLTTQHFVNYDKGELYGLAHTPDRYKQKFLQPRTPIPNLYLTGQDIVTCGVGAALFSGVLTVAAMTGKNVYGKIMKS